MGENLLCLRVSTSRYPTAASSHRTPILRCTVKVSSTHIDGFYTLGCLAFEVLQRDHSIMLFLQEDSVVPVDNSGFKQYDSAYANISNQSLTSWANRNPLAVFCLFSFLFFFLKCLMPSTWTRWWATSIHGEAILTHSWGSVVWTRSLQQSLTVRRCLCSSWKASSFSTTGINGRLQIPVRGALFLLYDIERVLFISTTVLKVFLFFKSCGKGNFPATFFFLQYENQISVWFWSLIWFSPSRALNKLFDQRYFLEIPYDVCKTRRGWHIF